MSRSAHRGQTTPESIGPLQQHGIQWNLSRSSTRTNLHPTDSLVSDHSAQPEAIENIRLIPTSYLPDKYLAFFPFGVFNAVQSSCYSRLLKDEENMIISAPTGSGKTVLFELAMIRFLEVGGSDDDRCIYIAPTKALCSEKYRDWSQKFQSIGINCCEMTGDSESHGKGAWAEARNAKIIITTPEKLDSLSRNWGDHEAIFGTIKLICVDEVHLLGDSRGSTLEACLSRMKMRAQSRFILVSATVPNAFDVASWIGSRDKSGPSLCLKFGDEYRPCKLTKHVYGFARNTLNSFQFDRTLNSKIFGILQRHCQGKPTLIFCPTRKGVTSTAEHLLKDYKEAQHKTGSLPWTPSEEEWAFSHASLQQLAKMGVGVHHAGLSTEDRRLTETGFLNGKLFFIVATSTLAVGVNLPCHTVIIKGTEMWDGVQLKGYADVDMVQMMGRAGRPQFDREGVAIIMCDMEQKRKYDRMDSNLSTLESCLHLSLPEHLNSEIVLGSVINFETAREWLRNTFLFKRIQANPSHYGISRGSEWQTWEVYFDALVGEALDRLKMNKLVTNEIGGHMSATEFGVIASRAYVKHASMNAIIGLPDNATKKDILLAISQASEFKDIRLRQGERMIYNKLCQHPDMRFELKKVEKPHEKIFVLLQALLGGISLSAPEYKNSDSILHLEALTVYKHAVRLMSCVVEAAIIRRASGVLKCSLELYRCLKAKAWEDRPIVLRQLESIGEKSIQVLASHGITNIANLRKVKPHQIETWLNRNPPFGKALLASADSFPCCSITIGEVEAHHPTGPNQPVAVSLEITCRAEVGVLSKPKGPRMRPVTVSILTCTSDLDFLDYRRVPLKALLRGEKTFKLHVELRKPSQSVEVYMSPDAYAGVGVMQTYQPNIPRSRFPVPDTRPQYDQNPLLTDENEASRLIPNQKDETTKKDISRAGHEMLSNGQYACGHRCRDKGSCHHRCCQEGLSKPPRSGRSIQKEGPDSKTHSSKPRTKDVPGQRSLLQQLDDLHNHTQKKTKFKESARLTMTRTHESKEIDIANDDESIPDVEELLKDKETLAQKDRFDFSDEEMEAAMADLPSPKLIVSTLANNGLKRRRSTDEGDPGPDIKRRKMQVQTSAPSKRPKQQRTQNSPQVIDLVSSSESSPTMISASNETPPRQADVGSPNTPLFLPSSPRPLEEPGPLSATMFKGQSDSDLWAQMDYAEDEMDFHLDPKLFEAEPEDPAEVVSMKPDVEGTSHSGVVMQQGLVQGNTELFDVGKEGQVPPTEKEGRETLFDGLDVDDDAAFDSFFSGVEIV